MYDVDIQRGRSHINDACFDYFVMKLRHIEPVNWLDIGCNTGALLLEYPHGTGIDASEMLVDRAKQKGLNVILGDATDLPFDNYSFQVATLNCVLEQIEEWEKALSEALRVSELVLGINPLPKSQWGVIGGWVKAIIEPSLLKKKYNACVTYPVIEGKYFFSIDNRQL